LSLNAVAIFSRSLPALGARRSFEPEHPEPSEP
jgi:hypothetical protein